MHIKGIKRGNTIELSQPVEGLAAIPDGTEVVLTLEPNSLRSNDENQANWYSVIASLGSASNDVLNGVRSVGKEQYVRCTDESTSLEELAPFNLRLSLPTSETSLTSLIRSASGSFETAEEADTFIRQERDAWDS